MGNGDIDFMQNADGVAFDAMGEGLVVTSPFSDDAAEVKNWEEKAEEVDSPETSKEITGDELADYFMAEFLKGDGEGDGDDELNLGRGVTLDKEQSHKGEDYSVGRWVAFPNARMSGKVRQIVDYAPSDCGFMAYWLTSPELEPSHRFKTVGMKLNGNKSFDTKEEAEKYLQEAESEFNKKILQIVTKDSLTDDKIFDPERFDQNSFEWGAIYWINQIRDAVEEFEDGYVVPDEQFIEMLRPLKKAAKVYAEAHGKDKAWVKNTVLSVPKAFANAFDTLSDGEGVPKEHFLKVLTVEGVCALAEGDIDSVHELENYYYRKGIYSPKGGYEVGRFVVIIKDPPSQKYESERIRHIIAIRGEKDDDDPILVFWNSSESGIVERKASQCSQPFHKCDDAYDWWFVENGDGARKVKKNSNKADEERKGKEIYQTLLSSMGITEDAEPDMADPDFWAKHDKARHGGHFDPETMTCKLREEAAAAEEKREKEDEIDDVEVESIPDEAPQEKGISRIFTGSSADYAKPSLMKVGTGEGSQVYGWGLYGSTERGVAEEYAKISSERGRRHKYTTSINGIELGSTDTSEEGLAVQSFNATGDRDGAIELLRKRIEAVKDGDKPTKYIDKLKSAIEILSDEHNEFVRTRAGDKRETIYEQTFFSDRAPGDESHLLKWYEPVTKEQLGWIVSALKANGVKRVDYVNERGQYTDALLSKVSEWLSDNTGHNVYVAVARTLGSPKAASEFLARAGIDGVKYPVDSYGGKDIKDGDEAGWNYVSFRDDNIRIDKKYVDGQKVYDYQELMAKHLPGVDAIAVLQRISKMGSPEAMAAEFRRILRKRKTYGVPYQGSKSRIAKAIVDILPSGKRFVDLFSGGGSVTHAAMDSGKYSKFRMNDIDGRGQRLFLEGVQGKWDDYSRETMTPEEFSRIKGTPESLPWSFNGLGRHLARSRNGRNYASEQISRVKSLSTLKDRSKDVEASETDYSKVKLRPGDVVYADIPYEATDTRGYGRGSVFDKQKFEEWAQKQAVPVYVSEYQMGDGWTEISSFNVPGMRGGNRTEKLYVQSKFADSASGSRKSSAEDSLDEIAAAAVEAAFGIGEDALNPNDADFWAKHDKARHGGHFDPETMTCKLREKYEQGEKIENLKDEMDDIAGEAPDVGSSGNAGSGNVTPEEDSAYMEAVNRGDMETAAKMVRDVAARAFPNTRVVDKNGIPRIVYHGTPHLEDIYEFDTFGRDKTEETGAWFTPFEKDAKSYARNPDEMGVKGQGRVYAVFLNIKNPRIINAQGAQWNSIPVPNTGGKKNQIGIIKSLRFGEHYIDGQPDWNEGDYRKAIYNQVYSQNVSNQNMSISDIKKLAHDIAYGDDAKFQLNEVMPDTIYTTSDDLCRETRMNGKNDGVFILNVVDGGGDKGDEEYDDYEDYRQKLITHDIIAFDSAQIKSADPVTYDDNGNVIPLSRRFDDGSDIRGDVNWRGRGDLNSDPDYGIISEVLKAEKDRQNGRPAQFHQRVPEETLRGGDEGTRILREASLICRATEGTGSQGEGNSGGGDGRGEGATEGAVSGVEQAREASRRQEAILEKYAKKLGIWEDDAATALKERDDYDYIEGGETIAFFPDDANKPLTKVITSAYFPETVQLLDRIMLHNYLFPYSKLDVKGFGRARPDWLTDGEPMFCVKVEQQAVDTSCPAKPEQIEEYMKNLGFHKHRELAGGDVVWESNDGKYVVSDLTDENVFLTQDGHIAVIDANIQLNTPSSDGSGHYKIPSFRSSGQAEDTLNEVLAAVVEAAYGIGEDALDMNDPDFWMKHDRARHGGHFDPETMTC